MPQSQVPTPGAYLKHRRTAAGLSVRDVARRLATEPRLAEHVRAELLELIEADAAPMSFYTVVALRAAYPFDLQVLDRLAAIALGMDVDPPRLCRICACSDHDGCAPAESGRSCSWWDEDLCTGCAGLLAAVA